MIVIPFPKLNVCFMALMLYTASIPGNPEVTLN